MRLILGLSGYKTSFIPELSTKLETSLIPWLNKEKNTKSDHYYDSRNYVS